MSAIESKTARHARLIGRAGIRTCARPARESSGMARLGIAPHVADKILNHQAGAISGVAAVYRRHDFLAERREALERWGTHVRRIIGNTFEIKPLRKVA
jgi:hypothetical protein